MDDLSFRKAVYAEPFTKNPIVIEAAKADPKKQAFWNELKAMEADLQAAMHIQVPENLAEKLILRQSLKQHSSVTKQRPWYFAIAASAVLATILTVGMLSGGNSGKFTNDVFAHVEHVHLELMKSVKVDFDAINSKLSAFNGHVNQEIGEVVSANYCYLDEIKSLHMIIRGENGLTSIFVVPDAISKNIGSSFSNASFEGASFLLDSAKIIIVGENKAEVESILNKARDSFSFSV